ncbi:MAG: NAD-glutamate dehydrogenase domain-containing protein, partial [Gaiellaceae bacterium]
AGEIDEVVALLNWLRDHHFVFLGFREYALEHDRLSTVKGGGLGILSVDEVSSYSEPVEISAISAALRARLLGGKLLVVSKTNSFSTVHRRGRMDDITIIATGPYGNTIGAHRLLGLFTSKAYTSPAGKVPILRHKLHQIATLEDFLDGSHDHKRLVETFESFPMDELFAATVDELRPIMVDLLELQERKHVEVYLRPDIDEGRVAAIVVVPRERFSGTLRKQIEALLAERLEGTSIDYHLAMSESSEARMHFNIYVPGEMPHVSLAELETTIVEMTRTWDDRLHERLVALQGEERARALTTRYGSLLPDAYKSVTDVHLAVVDLEHFEQLSTEQEFTVGLKNQRSHERDLTRVGLYKTGGKVRLSDFLPILEHLGLSVVEEVPTRLRDGGAGMYLHDIGVLGADDKTLNLTECGERVAEAISAVWAGAAISDSLNRLVVTSGLDWRQVSVLRAYRTYRRRLGVAFTGSYENDAFARNPAIARKLVELFELRLDPDRERDGDAEDALAAEIRADLDAVKSLDEDRILRAYLGLIEATLRTNAFLPDRDYVSVKLASELVPDMPEPRPLYEIFVQSPQMEGIHLRGGKIARGGIRWSDRLEDYRTEILGLMKAQMVKNVVIVPVGSKGGFVLRHPPEDRDARRAAVEAQYRVLIRGLLDLTDNRVGDSIVHPEGVVVRDDPDPYLVVAADRGTATFSDIANELAAEYGFWLDDAFASGGSIGYDHKELGITARGAWESVKRHFRELGIDLENDTHTAVGIGDMSGDVFGNGLLYSDRTRLLAAFDHRDIFIDPDPDPESSFGERKRLFELPRTTWADYDAALLSSGGGVWSRAEKRIELSTEARAALGIDRSDAMTPNELVAAILRAPVDLIWNGGIGTFVKASEESNADVGDRANDAVRING